MLHPTLQYALSILPYRKVFLTAGFLHFYPVKTTLYLNVYKEKYFSKEYSVQKRLYFNLRDNACARKLVMQLHGNSIHMLVSVDIQYHCHNVVCHASVMIEIYVVFRC